MLEKKLFSKAIEKVRNKLFAQLPFHIKLNSSISYKDVMVQTDKQTQCFFGIRINNLHTYLLEYFLVSNQGRLHPKLHKTLK